METLTNILCGICDAQHVTKCADFWCPECDDGLCTECNTHHSFSKSSRHHDVISIENYRKLPTDISSIVHHCTEHEKKFHIYCPHHDQLCCHLCLSTSHKECTGMLSIEEIAKTSKSSGLLESLQKLLEDLKSNIDNIVKDRQSNLIKIKEEQQNIYAGIKQLRERINSHFDKLEQEIVEELNAAELDMKMKIEDLFKELREKSERIAVLQNNISDLKNYASNFQTFVGSKKMERKIHTEETYIQSLSKDERLKQLSLKYFNNKEIENLLQSITSFGLMSKESSPPSVDIKLEMNKQAQILTASFIPKSVDNVCAKLIRKFQIPHVKSNENAITGCAIFPNGKIIFADSGLNMRLVIFNTDGSLNYEVPFSNIRPFDVACIDDTTVALTVRESSEIHLFDMKSKIIKNTIKTNSYCYGITYKDAKIHYGNKNGVGVIQINDNSLSSLVNLDQSVSYFCYVTSFGELLYFSNQDTDTVCCFNFKGEKIWEFSDETFLYGPAGVAVDRNGIVYVATGNSHGIIALSPDGKKVADFLTSEDGIENPYKLFCDSSRDVLLVAEHNGNCALFEIK
ncbi:unnamed protein product [Mytilus coruscus]|uniref:B box-type domain-containing protein n=1 Tax=Mytilus coruscus TaxID=42192 RepID=A0A6J8EMJ8_MYTCO|nr:unnamed protein product [Mytilus coruscus]